MRFLLKVNIPVESGNAAAKAGKLGATVQSILADFKPEAVILPMTTASAQGIFFSTCKMHLKSRRSPNRGSSRSMPASRSIPS
jgi:hypothetical protein